MTPADILAKPTFRLLLVPFGGPIARPGAPLGVDMDGEYFSSRTNIGVHLFPAGMPLAWHHGDDPALGMTRLGTAILDAKASSDGWWATCSWDLHEPAVALIRALAHRAEIFGSSQPLGRGIRKDGRTGEILKWAVAEATLTTKPSNVYARVAA